MIVVDATVVAGFLFSADDFHAQADAVRAKDPDWHCPELVFSEVRSVAMKHRRKGDTLDATIARCNLTARSGCGVSDALPQRFARRRRRRHLGL